MYAYMYVCMYVCMYANTTIFIIHTYLHTSNIDIEYPISLFLPFARLYTLEKLVLFNISSFKSSPTCKLAMHNSLRTLRVQVMSVCMGDHLRLASIAIHDAILAVENLFNGRN